jgi:hypothetical protein
MSRQALGPLPDVASERLKQPWRDTSDRLAGLIRQGAPQRGGAAVAVAAEPITAGPPRSLGLLAGEELARAGAPGRLVLAADVVSGGVLECPIPAKATSDGRALVFRNRRLEPTLRVN